MIYKETLFRSPGGKMLTCHFETFSINISDEFCFIDLGDVRKSLILEFEISGRRTGVLHNSSPAGL